MQPNQIKLFCSLLIACLCMFFAPSTLFAQAKAVPANAQARLQTRQAMVAQKTTLHTLDAARTTTAPQREVKTTATTATPLQTVAPIVDEELLQATPTEAVKPN